MKKSLQNGRSLSQPAKALLAKLWDSSLLNNVLAQLQVHDQDIDDEYSCPENTDLGRIQVIYMSEDSMVNHL
jgi:hypothetical protein